MFLCGIWLRKRFGLWLGPMLIRARDTGAYGPNCSHAEQAYGYGWGYG